MLARYRRLEASNAWGRVPLAALLSGFALLVATQVVTPRLPADAVAFLERAFHVRGLGAIVLLNDYLALYTVLFFGGAAQILQVVVAPREERQLDILLTKPLLPATFLAARATPVLLATAGVGVVLSLGCALAVAPYVAPGADGTVLGAFGAGLFVTAVCVALLAVANVVFLGLADGFQALMVGFAFWVAPLLPASVFLYRPDLFEGRPALASALVAPANLIWHDAVLPAAALVAGAIAMAASAMLVRLGGWRLGRMDLR